MNHITKIITTILLTSLVFSCSSYSHKNKMVINSTSVEDSQIQISQNKATILDVRTPEEYKIAHIEGAINLNVSSDTFKKDLESLSKDHTYILHCGTNVPNGRAAKALHVMNDQGFTNILSMDGGIVEWEEKKMPLIKAQADAKVKAHH